MHSSYLADGIARRAGLMAATLTQLYADRGDPAVAMGCQKAAGHLADEPECEEKAWFLVTQAFNSY